MFSKKMLLSYKRLNHQSFAMHDERSNQIVFTHHYEVTFRKSIWFGLIKKIVTENAAWNAPDKQTIEKQLDEKIGKWIK
jgi:hypothetical protein